MLAISFFWSYNYSCRLDAASCPVERFGTAYLLVSHNKSLTTGIAAAEEEEEDTPPRAALQQQRQGRV
jgi:hypothetical protein